MNLFIIKFKHDDGCKVEEDSALVIASSELMAKHIFLQRIDHVFTDYDDAFEITSVTQLQDDTNFIYIHGKKDYASSVDVI